MCESYKTRVHLLLWQQHDYIKKTTKTPQKLYKTIQSINTTLQICMIENLFPCELGDGGRIDHQEGAWSTFDRQAQQPIRMQDLVVQCKRR